MSSITKSLSLVGHVHVLLKAVLLKCGCLKACGPLLESKGFQKLFLPWITKSQGWWERNLQLQSNNKRLLQNPPLFITDLSERTEKNSHLCVRAVCLPAQWAGRRMKKSHRSDLVFESLQHWKISHQTTRNPSAVLSKKIISCLLDCALCLSKSFWKELVSDQIQLTLPVSDAFACLARRK